MSSLLSIFCSYEVKLLIARIEFFPEDFIDTELSYLSNLVKERSVWRRIVELGTYNVLERIILNYKLRKLDKEHTKKKIYEILI